MRDPASSAASASLTVELQPIDALVPDPKNARLHPERHIKQLAKSVEAFGFNCPVLVDRDNQVVAGHADCWQ
jgi:ParB-like chromosome segregation protein Spo0J